jgi:2-polyprenyl-3-methyl-5-hydroxy-6-metoxy-1,4-benzoquinol methylase
MNVEYGWASEAADPAHVYLLPAILRALPRSPVDIVDLGCGNGAIAGVLARRGYRVTGIDQAEDGIALARKANPALTFHCASVYDDLLKLVVQADVVLASEVIEHLYRPKMLLAAAHKVLRPGGLIIVTTPYHGYLKNLAIALAGKFDRHVDVNWDGGHIKFFSPRTLTSMVKAQGFREPQIYFAGRIPLLWKSMVLVATKPMKAEVAP